MSEQPVTGGTWSADALARIDAAHELEIAVRRADGKLRQPLPIWVVRVGERVYVRTWYRRDTGWFGHALGSGRARIHVPGLDADVTVQDLGEGTARLRADVDAAYRVKYGDAGAASMVTAAAAVTTLQLRPAGAGSRWERDGSDASTLTEPPPAQGA